MVTKCWRGMLASWVMSVVGVLGGPLAGVGLADEHELFEYFEDVVFDGSIPTPSSVLGYELGEHFSRHHDIVRYLEKVAEASDRVMIREYGRSHQRRPMHVVTISHPDNLGRLDEILERNRALADPETDRARVRRILRNNPSITWLSYNVHGNEPSPAETAMATVYKLAAAQGERIDQILRDSVVVVDPMLNPDGHERYVSWYDNVVGSSPNENPDASEHREPWPFGRTNHYLFDLNRDWLWLVHPESRGRMEVYREYLPHLHVDYHEMGFTRPYFFGAGDTPYNLNIPQETRDWIDIYGDENAKVFDRKGLLYATRERFDYMYPGYGKVTPVYHGAVGLLTEKAGHGRAGLAIEVNDHYTLTLRERIHHHFLTSMNYVEVTADRRRAQLERFREYFVGSVRLGRESPMTYYVTADNDPALLEKLWDLSQRHGIEIHTLDSAVGGEALRCYWKGDNGMLDELPEGSWVIRTDQAMGRLVRVLFERDPEVEDKDTYDITSWSLPVGFGLRAFYSEAPFEGRASRLASYEAPRGELTGEGSVAYLIDGSRHSFPAVIGLAVEHDLVPRFTGEDIEIEGKAFPRGSLIVHRIRNEHADLDGFVEAVLDLGVDVHYSSTGMTEVGHVLAANTNDRFTLPKVALLRGPGVSLLSFGQIWHTLDLANPIPHTVVNLDDVRRTDLSRFNVIVVPDGASVPRSTRETLDEWVRGGGTLIAVGSSGAWANREILGLESDDVRVVDEDRHDEEVADEEREPLYQLSFEERRQRNIEDRIPGATVGVSLDTTHPLATGAGDWIGIIKRNSRRLPVRSNGYVVGTFSHRIGGSISERNEARLAGTAFMTHHGRGRGRVISLADDPTLRGFNHGPKRLLLNAIIYGPSF